MTDIIMSEAPLPLDPTSISTCMDLDAEPPSRDKTMHNPALASAPPPTPAATATTSSKLHNNGAQTRDPATSEHDDTNLQHHYIDKQHDCHDGCQQCIDRRREVEVRIPTAKGKKWVGWKADRYRGPGPTWEITDCMAELMGVEPESRREGEREGRGGGQGGGGGGGGGGQREDRRDGGGGGGGGGGGFRRNDRKRRFRGKASPGG